MSDFRFPIGSFVRLAISAKQKNEPIRWASANSCLHDEERGQILGRELEECSAGIQRYYLIRWTTMRGSTLAKAVRHVEIELVASEEFPAAETPTKDGINAS